MGTHLISAVSKELGIPKTEAAKVTKAVVASMKDVLTKRGTVSAVNFGSFSIKEFKRDSKLRGETYHIEKNVVRFKTSKNFSNSLNK